LRIPSAAVRSVNGQFSRLSVRAVATQPAPLYPDVGQDEAEKLGFEKVSEEFISECKSKAILFKHKKTGCEVMSVSNEDENKVFGVVFRTPPKDSTGIPHILEHSVLCGSRKYPVKEPFVELLKGSLHTFLNAFTYPDRTCYPVASTNTKDFYNLVDVYLDAVFFPKCVDDAHTFQQEGWHYELNDPSEDISYKGVVFNEMKGVYSQPDNILGRIAQQALTPENT
jgi:Zn-dependent M16 (insulinase) family peptidase